jgi:hypothetical protein
MGASDVKMKRLGRIRKNTFLRAAKLSYLHPDHPAPVTSADAGAWTGGSTEYERYVEIFGEGRIGPPNRLDNEHRLTALCMAHAMRQAGDL